MRSPHSSRYGFRRLGNLLPDVLEAISQNISPENQALQRVCRDLLIWQECLRRCAPDFAKNFIMKLRELEAIDDAGTTLLILRLKLEAV